jgi:hypothetical protein
MGRILSYFNSDGERAGLFYVLFLKSSTLIRLWKKLHWNALVVVLVAAAAVMVVVMAATVAVAALVLLLLVVVVVVVVAAIVLVSHCNRILNCILWNPKIP